MKETVKKIPLVGPLIGKIYRAVVPGKPFTSSEDYWKQRYAEGGNSGLGSYHQLAEFKAEILNAFVTREKIESVLELGSGDGNQLRLARYPRYTGYDISSDAIARCSALFAGDPTKEFYLMSDPDTRTADLAMSLDVVYHLVEDEVFDGYMRRLFSSATRFVVVYASNTDVNPPGQSPHVRHRKFTDWIEVHQPDWELAEHIPNRYRGDDPATGSFADFFFFRRKRA